MRVFEEMPVEAVDGPCGEVADIVVDPVRRRVTHLAVRPHGAGSHLVPIDAVVSCEDRVRLSWTAKQVTDAERLEETDFLALRSWPHLEGGWDVGIVRVLAWPYYVADRPGADDVRTTTEFDRIPAGTAEIRRESPVETSDGEVVGHVDGLVLDDAHNVTHVVLDKGHLWGRREISIPIGAVDHVETDLVRLRVTRKAVGDFPSVPFRRHRE